MPCARSSRRLLERLTPGRCPGVHTIPILATPACAQFTRDASESRTTPVAQNEPSADSEYQPRMIRRPNRMNRSSYPVARPFTHPLDLRAAVGHLDSRPDIVDPLVEDVRLRAQIGGLTAGEARL